MLDNILLAGQIRPIVIQSLFMKVHDEAPSDEEIAEFVKRLVELRDAGCQIKLVQVYTVARQTAESFVTPLDREHVDAIADRVLRNGSEGRSVLRPDVTLPRILVTWTHAFSV